MIPAHVPAQTVRMFEKSVAEQALRSLSFKMVDLKIEKNMIVYICQHSKCNIHVHKAHRSEITSNCFLELILMILCEILADSSTINYFTKTAVLYHNVLYRLF